MQIILHESFWQVIAAKEIKKTETKNHFKNEKKVKVGVLLGLYLGGFEH